MKRSVLLILFYIPMHLFGQIGVCGMEEQVGTLDYQFNIDPLPEQFDLGHDGPNNQWFFSELRSPRTYTYRVMPGDFGNYAQFFEGAKRVVEGPDGTETYLMQRGDKWYMMGEVVPSTSQREAQVRKYELPLRYCAQDFVKRYRGATKYAIGERQAEVSLVARVDAEGVLYLPDGYYDVKRLKKELVTIEGTQQERKFVYDFIDSHSNELIMTVTTDSEDQLQEVIYKTNRIINNAHLSGGPNQFHLYPSTGYGDVRLEFSNFKKGRYQLLVKDIVGRQIWSGSFDVTDDMTIKEDLTFLPRGTYTYLLLDAYKNIVVARRLAIIKS